MNVNFCQWTAIRHRFGYAGRKSGRVEPARAAVPDRMFVAPSGKVFFIEFKASGKKPTLPQTREHQRVRDHGVLVLVVDNVDEGKGVIDFVIGVML